MKGLALSPSRIKRVCDTAASVSGLGTTIGRGTATNFQEDLQSSDCILFMGSNMAEAHPVGFRFPMKAKERGAQLIHVDPHYTRTSAMCHQYVPLRAGTDIAFLGGLINYVLMHERWFKEYVLAYTNATSLVNEEFVDAKQLGGLFQGFDEKLKQYDTEARRWNYKGEPNVSHTETPQHIENELWSERLGHLNNPVPQSDSTLENPNCVLNILRRHFARYTPEMVARICGCTPEQFTKVAESLCDNSGRERTSAIVYGVGWTHHTTGVQIIRAAGILQLLLGNIGRPGGGIMAMRGHASIHGSTDIPTLYNMLPGYIPQPAASHRRLRASRKISSHAARVEAEIADEFGRVGALRLQPACRSVGRQTIDGRRAANACAAQEGGRARAVSRVGRGRHSVCAGDARLSGRAAFNDEHARLGTHEILRRALRFEFDGDRCGGSFARACSAW